MDINHPCPSMLLARFLAPPWCIALLGDPFVPIRGEGGVLHRSRNKPGVFLPLNTITTHVSRNIHGYVEKMPSLHLPNPNIWGKVKEISGFGVRKNFARICTPPPRQPSR